MAVLPRAVNLRQAGFAMKYSVAPLEGITDHIYRSIHMRFFPGADRYYTPFLSPTQNHFFTPREQRAVYPVHNPGQPLVPQLLTKNAEDFLWAAGALAELGYEEVNLNLGCPSRTVTAKGKGSGLLLDPIALDALLEQIFAKAPLRISVKTRIGYHDEAEFASLLELLNRYPLSELIVHPRTTRQLYAGSISESALSLALAQSRAPVCCNPSLSTAAECAAFAAAHPSAKALMLGRGLIADPALIRKCKGGAPAVREELLAFHTALSDAYQQAFGGVHNTLPRMKEIWRYQIHLFADSEKHARRIAKAMRWPEFVSAVEAVFHELRVLPDAAGLQLR